MSGDYESYKAFRKDILGRWWLKRLIWVAIGVPLVFLLAHSVSSFLANEAEVIADRAKCYWIIVFVFSIWPAGVLHETVRALIAQRPKKIFNDGKAMFAVECHYSFFAERLIAEVPHYHCAVGYAHYTEARESKSSFYLKKPEGTYVQLPKKCFTDEQAAALRELFARKFGEKFKQYKQK
ncbi:MAG: YcxB family protein [Oscillospiraceae bacterium]|nr:YcxB family protein [Oscillospiraceae bacterium]